MGVLGCLAQPFNCIVPPRGDNTVYNTLHEYNISWRGVNDLFCLRQDICCRSYGVWVDHDATQLSNFSAHLFKKFTIDFPIRTAVSAVCGAMAMNTCIANQIITAPSRKPNTMLSIAFINFPPVNLL